MLMIAACQFVSMETSEPPIVSNFFNLQFFNRLLDAMVNHFHLGSSMTLLVTLFVASQVLQMPASGLFTSMALPEKCSP